MLGMLGLLKSKSKRGNKPEPIQRRKKLLLEVGLQFVKRDKNVITATFGFCPRLFGSSDWV